MTPRDHVLAAVGAARDVLRGADEYDMRHGLAAIAAARAALAAKYLAQHHHAVFRTAEAA